MGSQPLPSDLESRRRRPGLTTFLTGLATSVAAAHLTITLTYPTGLGVMLGLIALYAVAAYLVISGLVRMRAKEDERDPVGADITPGTRSLRCAMFGHKEVFSPRTDTQPAGFRCRRCGAHGPRHLNVGRPWMCEIPFVDHLYDVVGKTADSPQYWRCRRCGKRRANEPTSAGETLDATRVELMWIKRHDD